MRAGDQHAALGAHQLSRLVQHDLNRAWILAVLGTEPDRPLAGRHDGEVDDAPLGLGDDLVRDHDDVRVSWMRAGALDERDDVRPWLDLGQPRNGRCGQGTHQSESSVLRVRAARPRVAARRSRRASRSAPVSTSSSSDGGCATEKLTPACIASRR